MTGIRSTSRVVLYLTSLCFTMGIALSVTNYKAPVTSRLSLTDRSACDQAPPPDLSTPIKIIHTFFPWGTTSSLSAHPKFLLISLNCSSGGRHWLTPPNATSVGLCWVTSQNSEYCPCQGELFCSDYHIHSRNFSGVKSTSCIKAMANYLMRTNRVMCCDESWDYSFTPQPLCR